MDKVMDSTRGNAYTLPVNYKRDAIMSWRYDSRFMASLILHFEKTGQLPKTLSEVVSTMLESVVYNLVKQGDMEFVESVEEARNIIQERFNVQMNPGGRYNRNIRHNMVLDEYRGVTVTKAEEVRSDQPTARLMGIIDQLIEAGDSKEYLIDYVKELRDAGKRWGEIEGIFLTRVATHENIRSSTQQEAEQPEQAQPQSQPSFDSVVGEIKGKLEKQDKDEESGSEAAHSSMDDITRLMAADNKAMLVAESRNIKEAAGEEADKILRNREEDEK